MSVAFSPLLFLINLNLNLNVLPLFYGSQCICTNNYFTVTRSDKVIAEKSGAFFCPTVYWDICMRVCQSVNQSKSSQGQAYMERCSTKVSNIQWQTRAEMCDLQ